MPASSNPALTAGWVSDPKGTADKCVKAIRKARGVIKAAAKELGVDRRTLWRYIRDHKELAAELKAMRKAHHGRKPLWEGTRGNGAPGADA